MTMLDRKALRPVLTAMMMGLFILIMAACNTNPTTAAQGATNTNVTQLANNNQLKGQTNALGSQLVDPGNALLLWSPQVHTLTVTVSVSGLVPNSVHPNHIHLGNCTSNGAIQYPLQNIVADKNGKASATTIIPNVANDIPANGWYLNIHQGPGLATMSQMAPIYCGNIVNSSANTDQTQIVKVKLNQVFLNHFANVDKVASTVPANGDVNPYGVAVVQKSIGNLVKGNVLVSNFNNGANLQGLGSTIVQISPNGTQSTFAQLSSASCPDGIGLTTALVELKRGWVIVGSLPAANGKFANAKAGCLIVVNSQGQPVETFTGSQINGPWDASVLENGDGSQATLFVTNILNGTVAGNTNIVNQGTVARFNLDVPNQSQSLPTITSKAVIATGFAEKTDAAALVIGPTGIALGKNNTLYVADTLNNRVIAIPDALNRQGLAHADKHVLTTGGSLNGELGLTIAPNGDILTVNGADGNIVEITPNGMQIGTKLISTMGTPPGAGCLFGLATAPNSAGVYFVDDCTNQLNILH
jgi:hypothetical protein